MMRQRIYKLIFTFLMVVLSLEANADIPNQVVIHYSGNIISKPCAVSLSNGNTVDLGDIDGSKVNQADYKSAWIVENIHFSDCDLDTNISLSSSMPGGVINATNNNSFKLFLSDFMNPKKVGVDVYLDDHGKEVNMRLIFSGYNPYIITPEQRAVSDVTSYDVGLKFRIIHDDGALGDVDASDAGRFSAVYQLAVEYL